MKTPEEYRRSLYEKRDRALSERKMTRRSIILSLSSAAACLLIVFSVLMSPVVELFPVGDKKASEKKILIEADGELLRSYEDKETISGVVQMFSQMTLLEEKPDVREEERLYIVTKINSNDETEIFYYVERRNTIQPSSTGGISSVSVSMSDVLERYP